MKIRRIEMKKTWINTEIEIIAINSVDVITTSPTTPPKPGDDNYEGEIDW